MIQSLVERGPVTVLSRVPFNPVEIDHHYGTSLSGLPIQNIVATSSLLEWLAKRGIPVALARLHYLMRVGRSLGARYSLICSAKNEQNFGRPSIDYIHYPWNSYPRPESAEAWNSSFLFRAVTRIYNSCCCRLSGFGPSRPKNLTLANSSWTRDKYHALYPDMPCGILYPPALAEPVDARTGRKRRFLSIGRICPSKRWLSLIDIVSELRARGHDVGLTLAGSRDNREYEREVVERIRQEGNWVEMRVDQSREELQVLLSSHEFGLHGMLEEHFGMAVAELVLGGCLTFVPNSGGQVEIVSDPFQRYDSPEDAVAKLDRVLNDDALQADLLVKQSEHRMRFTREAFLRRFGDLVDRALQDGLPAVVTSETITAG